MRDSDIDEGDNTIPLLNYERWAVTRRDTMDVLLFKEDKNNHEYILDIVDDAVEVLIRAGVDVDVEVVTLQ